MPNVATAKSTSVERPPVVVVLGHVDHGKSTLLDYIRKTNTVDKEIGGITQHVAAYEVEHAKKPGPQKRITFLDTPGHEAFEAIRHRSTHIADIAILIVSAEEGVREQTKEALKIIKNKGIPFVVAINKIDKPNASVEKSIANLAKHEIYLEGHGGDVPYTAISAKTGEGVDSLLEILLLVAELEELTGDTGVSAEGVVIESHRNPKKGVTATLLITNGTLKSGMYVAAGKSTTPTRMLQDFAGVPIEKASFSSPVQIVGWNIPPVVGTKFNTFISKRDAESYTLQNTEPIESTGKEFTSQDTVTETVYVPIIIKADVAGSIDAIRHELEKIEVKNIEIRVVRTDVGAISEKDIKAAGGDKRTIILGFHTQLEDSVNDLARRDGITLKTFDIIYKLTEWLEEEIKRRTPKDQHNVEIRGSTTVLRLFSETKKAQVIGGRVNTGSISVGDYVNIVRRGELIGDGIVRELQAQKKSTEKVTEGNECGIKVATTTTIAQKDVLESTSA